MTETTSPVLTCMHFCTSLSLFFKKKTITYTLTAVLFQGMLTVKNNLDREITSSYTIRIVASDSPDNLAEKRSTLQTVTIIVEDINDNPPVFRKAEYNESVLENAGVGSSVGQVEAFDKDFGDNAMIKYYLANNTIPQGLFRMDEDDGEIWINSSLVNHQGLHVLLLMAEDQGDPKLNGTAVINITILDVNMNSPVITNIPNDNTIKVYEVGLKLK